MLSTAEELRRIAELRSLEILDTEPEAEFDAIVRLASEICGTPLALCSLVDEQIVFHKSVVGFDLRTTPRAHSFCAQAIEGESTLVVPRASDDPRFVECPLRVGPPHAEFYVGVPLRTSSGARLGALAVMDVAPRRLTDAQRHALEALAQQIVRILEMRRIAMQQTRSLAELRRSDAEIRAEMMIAPPPRSRWTDAVAWLSVALALASVAGFALLESALARDASRLAAIARSSPFLVLFAGLAIAALLHALVRVQRATEVQARELARKMTGMLARSEHELREMIDGTTDFVLTFGPDESLLLTNRAFRTVLGFDDEAVEHLRIADVIRKDLRARFHEELTELRREKVARYLRTVFVARDGTHIEVEGALSFVTDAAPQVTRAIFRDISSRLQAERALRAANAALERLASTDGLTHLANRRTFDEALRYEIGRARRVGAPLSVVLIDVDHFKAFNDRYGHPEGDACLRRIGGVLLRTARRVGEVAARYGGEEFALLLPGVDATGATELAETARSAIRELHIPHADNASGLVTASFGVAELDPAGMDASAFLVAADAALYRAKSRGRDRVEIAA